MATFGNSHMPYEYDESATYDTEDWPHLHEMVDTALTLLSSNNPNGFFLMIECGRIDHAGHENDGNRNVYETQECDKMFSYVEAFTLANPDTLTIVTADHETGGLGIVADNGAGNAPTVSWSTNSHTDVDINLYAYGIWAQWIDGMTLDNEQVHDLTYLVPGMCVTSSPSTGSSPSPSVSISSSQVVLPSFSTSRTISTSISETGTISPSKSRSITNSPTLSPSPSRSISNTPSPSKSHSTTYSESTSPSPSRASSISNVISVTITNSPSLSRTNSETPSSTSNSITPSGSGSISVTSSISHSPSVFISDSSTETVSRSLSRSSNESPSVSSSSSISPSISTTFDESISTSRTRTRSSTRSPTFANALNPSGSSTRTISISNIQLPEVSPSLIEDEDSGDLSRLFDYFSLSFEIDESTSNGSILFVSIVIVMFSLLVMF